MVDDWTPPSEFDRIKELNAQGGRLATVVGLLFAASSFSFGSDAFRMGLRLSFVEMGGLIVTLVALALSLFHGLSSSVGVLHPTIPKVEDDRSVWEGVVVQKQEHCFASTLFVQSSALLLLVAWVEAVSLGSVPLPFNAIATWVAGLACAGWFVWTYMRFGALGGAR